jgi:hypothetical protein
VKPRYKDAKLQRIYAAMLEAAANPPRRRTAEAGPQAREGMGLSVDAARANLLAWFRAEYARRTAAVEAGTASIDWIVPDYRVSWSEVLAKAEALGLPTNHGEAIELRLWLGKELGQ